MKRGIMLFGALAAIGTLTAAQLPLEEGFEDDLATLRGRGWTLHSTASLVRDDAPGGSQCLRMEVPDGQKRYAELFIPVEAGKFYRAEVRMRAEEVKTHPAAGSNRGAVIFLQWADHQKKHVSGGAFPRGLRGTHGWTTRRVSHTNRIPENVGFLHVMLGVEGQGTAWFDDLRVSEIASGWDGPELLQPAVGETVSSQGPDVAWEEMSGLAYRLEFSRDGQFAPETTIAGEVRGTTGRPAGWLAPGEWHVRITPLLARDNPLPEPQSHRFTVAADAVAWPLQLTQDWSWSDAPRPELAVVATPPNVPIHTVEALIDGVPAELLDTASGRIRFRPGSDLAAGVHEVRVTVSPPPGQTTLAPVTLTGIFCNKQPASRVTFRADGIMLVDGVPRFPLGAYRDPSDREDVFDGLLEAGFDVTHSYRMDNAAIKEPETRKAYLEAAHANGIGVFLGMPRDMVRERKTTELARYVAETMDTPGLLAWYQFDEPEIQNCTPEDLMATYRALRAVDPFHPKITLVCSISRPVSDLFRRYAAGCDIFWEDPYPVPSKPLLMVEEKILACRDATGPGKPVWCVLQGFSWEAWKAHGKLSLKGKHKRSDETVAAMRATGTIPVTRPSAIETRCMAHLAIAAGANGLIWYWSPNCAVHVKEDSPEVWAGIKSTVRELRSLMPWLLAEPSAADEISLPPPLRGWSRIAEGTRLLALVNSGPEPATLALDLTPWNATTATDHETGETMPLQDGRTTLEFAPHQVRLLRF